MKNQLHGLDAFFPTATKGVTKAMQTVSIKLML